MTTEIELIGSEIDRLQDERSAIDKRLQVLRDRYEELSIEILGLPTTPGWYFLPDMGVMAKLGNDGHWEDGWGNSWEELEELSGAVSVRIPE